MSDPTEPTPGQPQESSDSSLQAPHAAHGQVPAPLAAMAEALRANAEALQRIDDSQRKLADTMERSDRATQVVTSTKALNETFRGLTEIQRGLLDALVRRHGGGAVTATVLVGLVGVALLAGFVGFWLADRAAREAMVPRTTYEQALSDVRSSAEREQELRRGLAAAVDREKELERGRQELREALGDAEQAGEQLQGRIARLETEAETNRARLEQFLEVKARADLAGQLQQRSLVLERENRDLRERVDRLAEERQKLMGFLGDKLLDRSFGDPEAILDEARRRGLIDEPPAPPSPDSGVIRLAGRSKQRLVQQINRLLPDDEEAFELLDVGSVEGGARLRDVTLARYHLGRMTRSLEARELTILVDLERDTVELRLQEGHMVNTSRPHEKIPIGESGHSIFLKGARAREWLEREGRDFSLGEKGRLTWKTGPS